MLDLRPVDDPDLAWQDVQRAGQGLRAEAHDTAHSIGVMLLRQSWRRFTRPGGRVVEWDDFRAFVEAPLPDGLETDLKDLEWVCRRQPDVLDLIDQAVQKPKHVRRSDGDTITITDPNARGTARLSALRKLRSDRPDLHAQVLAGDLSAHAAMVAAGFRRPQITVPINDMDMLAARLRRHLDEDQQAELRRAFGW